MNKEVFEEHLKREVKEKKNIIRRITILRQERKRKFWQHAEYLHKLMSDKNIAEGKDMSMKFHP